MKRVLWVLSAAVWAVGGLACTNLIVGRGASVDGSVFVSYSADSYGCCGVMRYYPRGLHAEGEVVEVYDWESNRYRGAIPQVAETYNVVGNVNEWGLCLAETTFGGREELVDTSGIMDYGSLIYLALQRARTAREAIGVIADLVASYGYGSEGESFSVADKEEAWIMEMVGKAGRERGAVWVAVRIPDDCISAHANQARIHRFSQYGADDCLYSPDVVSFARRMGLYEGSDEDFDFAATYCPLDFSGARICEGRVWSFFSRYADGMEGYLSYAMGEDLGAEPMPLYVKPKRRLSLGDVESSMRDHFEGTPMEMAQDGGSGLYGMPYRVTPLTFEVDGVEYFNERPISTQQASFVFVAQLRGGVASELSSVIWWGHDDGNMVPFTPVYGCASRIPECYSDRYGDDVSFSLNSAFWVQNWVSNMVYPRYGLMFGDLQELRDRLDSTYQADQAAIEAEALRLRSEEGGESAVAFLTDYGVGVAEEMLEAWTALGWRLVVKYNDFIVHPERDGVFVRTAEGRGATVLRPGMSESVKRRIVEETGERYKCPVGNGK